MLWATAPKPDEIHNLRQWLGWEADEAYRLFIGCDSDIKMVD